MSPIAVPLLRELASESQSREAGPHPAGSYRLAPHGRGETHWLPALGEYLSFTAGIRPRVNDRSLPSRFEPIARSRTPIEISATSDLRPAFDARDH